MHNGRSEKGARRGFTLVEVMVVIAIIGLMAAVIVPQVMSRMDEAQVKTTRLQIAEIESAVNMFRLDNGSYPERLDDLVVRPADAATWPRGGYLKQLPQDGWGRGFEYTCPGSRGPFDIVSYGADGQPGGEDENADISNWPVDGR